MPTGRVQRIDDERGLVYLVWRGETITAPIREVDTRARHPNAPVLFTLSRRHGAVSATAVRLRQGTRSNRRQRRYGDLTGARRPGAKVDNAAKGTYGVDVTTQPVRVARAWVEAMSDADFDGATSLCSPEAQLHTSAGTVGGHRAIRAELERSPLAGVDGGRSHYRGIDRFIRIDFPASDEADAHIVYAVIDFGAIVEQWIDVEPAIADDVDTDHTIRLICRGPVPDGAKDHANEKLAHLIERIGRPVTFARVKLTAAPNPSIGQPSMVEMTIEVDHDLVRAHGRAPSFTEAIDLVIHRLDVQIEHRRDRRRPRPMGRGRRPDGWQPPRPYLDRPESEREIVRHKSVAPDEQTVDEAAWDMDQLDYDFFLFVETTTGQDALLEHRPDGSLVLRLVDGDPAPPIDATAEIDRPDFAAAELSVGEAIEILNGSHEPRHFFVNRATGRANVVYRRFDGHYGLITPPPAT